ncbi:hypothetical protein [Parablautia sp. Marseille-Q6255]|uniref:hypothetical protein n=1 Tax=Parablautia sp. Marseille-Q6255 TaxID=3039593 RepID=UPI0024BCD4BA|nr:hypothetical protein [Parablautia sp. Marseille-Q6255]
MRLLQKYRKWIIKGVCFVLGFCLLFWVAQRLLSAKWLDRAGQTGAWMEFRELEPDTVDALFLGTSHTYSGIDPMYIYENSGITSFALSGPGMRFDLTYMVLKDALKTQKPKVVFLDMSSVHFDRQQTEGRIHKVLDQLPLSKEKLKFAFHTDNDELSTLDALFPLFRYHSRWEMLEQQDFQYAAGSIEAPVWRGHYVNYRVAATEYYFYEEGRKDGECHIEGRALECLRKIDQLCKDEGIQLVLYKIPAPTWYKLQSDGSAELAEEFGVPFLELFYCVDEIGLDPATDFRDRKNHLNQYGAEKVSGYMMKYMQNNFEMEDQRGKNADWDQDLILYQERKAEIASGAVA